MTALPPLPDPAHTIGGRNVWLDAYTADQLRAYGAACAAAERERCAKLAAETVCDTHLPTGVRIYGTRVAAAIRAQNEP